MVWSGLPTRAIQKRTKLLPVYVRYGELARRSEGIPKGIFRLTYVETVSGLARCDIRISRVGTTSRRQGRGRACYSRMHKFVCWTCTDGKTAERAVKVGTAVWSEAVTHGAKNIGYRAS
jgi:hypothetical protein